MATKKGKRGKAAKGGTQPEQFGGLIERKHFKRAAIKRTLAAARQPDTEPDFESQLIAQVLSYPKLDAETHFLTVMFLALMHVKFSDLSGTQRQALLSDPDYARVLYPHIRTAFPEQVRDAFNVYFRALAEQAPHVLDWIQRRAVEPGEKGGKD